MPTEGNQHPEDIRELLARSQTEELTDNEIDILAHNLTLHQIDQLPQDIMTAVWDKVASDTMAQQHMLSATSSATSTALQAFIEEIIPRIDTQQIADLTARLNETITARSHIMETVQQACDQLAGTVRESDAWRRQMEKLETLSTEVMRALRDVAGADTLKSVSESFIKLLPYIEQILDENPEAARMSFQQIKALAKKRMQAETMEQKNQRIQESKAKRINAENLGAVTDGGPEYFAVLAKKGMDNDFLTSNKIYGLRGPIEEHILENGKFIDIMDPQNDLVRLDRVHTGFLSFLLSLALSKTDLRETNSGNAIIPIYIPAVLKKWGIDYRNRDWSTKRDTGNAITAEASPEQLRYDAFMNLARPLMRAAGRLEDGVYSVLTFMSWDKKTETVVLSIPYMFKLIEQYLGNSGDAPIRYIFHANVMTENQTALEVASRLAIALVMRGVTRADKDAYGTPGPKKTKEVKTRKNKDGTTERTTTFYETQEIIDKDEVPAKAERTFTVSISFASLIRDCPQLADELEAIRNPEKPIESECGTAEEYNKQLEEYKNKVSHKSQRANKKLRDVFQAAVNILVNKSDAPQYYKDFDIFVIPASEKSPWKYQKEKRVMRYPTNSTLSDKLVLFHKGKNPAYIGHQV